MFSFREQSNGTTLQHINKNSISKIPKAVSQNKFSISCLSMSIKKTQCIRLENILLTCQIRYSSLSYLSLTGNKPKYYHKISTFPSFQNTFFF